MEQFFSTIWSAVRDYGLAVTIVVSGMVCMVLGIRTVWSWFREDVWPDVRKSVGAIQGRFVQHLDNLDTCTEKMSKSVDTLNDTLRECQAAVTRQAEGITHLAQAVKSCPVNPALRDYHADQAAGKSGIKRLE